ncbi:MAG: sulfatase-like hydrolase/transferase [Deltaproteobacteria bacterium]|nr:sulfatase-like hydrolase/transferase [Deltaproteobacteria bacterium]
MIYLLQAIAIAVLALLGLRLPKGPTRARLLTALKAWTTVVCFWALLAHPMKNEAGEEVIALQLIAEILGQVDPGTFWLFVGLATSIKVVGMLSSMWRWKLMLVGQGIELPFKHIFGSFLIGRAIGTFLPSTAGLDGYTLFDAARFSGRSVEVTAAKFVEKVCGFSGVFMTFLATLPFGIAIFGENARFFAMASVPIAAGVIGGLVVTLLFPGFVQWILATVPIPAKQRITGLVSRISSSAAAYRTRPGLVLQILFLSFLVHFTTAAMYYFTALAIGAVGADFWEVTFGSSIQIFVTVISPFTIAGEGIREAAQYVLLKEQIGGPEAIVSAALGFWAAEAPTMLGFLFWWARGADYRPAFARVDGVQVDYDLAAREATSLDEDVDVTAGEIAATPIGERLWRSASAGCFAGIVAGLVLGLGEAIVIARGGLGTEAQVFWYGPLMWAAVLGGLSILGGLFLAVLPMDRQEIGSWVPRLGLGACLVPFGLFVVLFRLRRDVYLEQMPPLPVLLGVLLGGAVLLALILGPLRLLLAPIAARLATPLAPIAALLLGVFGLGGALSLAYAPPAPEEPAKRAIPAGLASRPNVILVMVDTLRADHLSCYGAEIRTPNLCRLAEEGTLYKAFSHASWTKPATASLLSSTVPSTHRAMSKPASLSQELTLVSEALQQGGYTTAGIVSNVNLAESFGFDQGYDDYYYLAPDYIARAQESSSKLIVYQLVRQVVLGVLGGKKIWFNDYYQDSQVVNRTAFDWLDARGDERFFLFLHYMDPHDPYFEHPYNGVGVARVSMPEPDPKLADRLATLYRGEIEYLDVQFGELLAKLEAMGVYDDTVIALTADHGEEFNEHGGFWHGLTLYDEQIHVPLLVKWSRHERPPAERVATGLARSIDVAPTLLGTAGIPVPESMQGVDLRRPFTERAEKDRQVFSEEDHEGNVLWSLRTEEEKLIVANEHNPRGLPAREYFDLTNDPGETDPFSEPDAEARLEELARLQRLAAEGKAVTGGAAEMSREDCERLRVLGYVESCDGAK